MGQRQAGHRARLRHRRHPAGVAEAGRRLARADHRRRARPRRRTQLRHAAADCGGARGQEGDGAAAPSGHAEALARRRRGTARHQGLLRARRRLQGRRHLHLRARRRANERRLGRQRRQRHGLGGVRLQGRERARRGRAMARPLGARRGRADGHRLELPPRAPAHPAALALRDPQRRRSAQRRPAQRLGLVLLPRDQLRGNQEALGHRQQHGEGRHDDDRHRVHDEAARLGVARPHEQDGGRDDAREHREGGAADSGPRRTRRSPRRCSAR